MQRKQSNLPLVGAMTRSALSLVHLAMSQAAYTLEPYVLVPLPDKGRLKGYTLTAVAGQSKLWPHLQGRCDVYVEHVHDGILRAHSF